MVGLWCLSFCERHKADSMGIYITLWLSSSLIFINELILPNNHPFIKAPSRCTLIRQAYRGSRWGCLWSTVHHDYGHWRLAPSKSGWGWARACSSDIECFESPFPHLKAEQKQQSSQGLVYRTVRWCVADILKLCPRTWLNVIASGYMSRCWNMLSLLGELVGTLRGKVSRQHEDPLRRLGWCGTCCKTITHGLLTLHTPSPCTICPCDLPPELSCTSHPHTGPDCSHMLRFYLLLLHFFIFVCSRNIFIILPYGRIITDE